MMTAKRPRPISVVFLAILMLFQALGAFSGGIPLVLDPTGETLGIPVSALDGSPFPDFFWPGLILLFVLGVFPFIVTYALWVRPVWRAAATIESWFGEHWAWVGALIVSVGLLIWCTVELWIVGYTSLLLIFSIVGLAMLVLTLLPGVRRYYALRQKG